MDGRMGSVILLIAAFEPILASTHGRLDHSSVYIGDRQLLRGAAKTVKTRDVYYDSNLEDYGCVDRVFPNYTYLASKGFIVPLAPSYTPGDRIHHSDPSLLYAWEKPNGVLVYDKYMYPNRLFVHVHIPKTAGTTLISLFKTRNCGYSTYKLRRRAYIALKRMVRNASMCGFFSHEFPSFFDAITTALPQHSKNLLLHAGYSGSSTNKSYSRACSVSHNSTSQSGILSHISRPFFDLIILRDPLSHFISAFAHLRRLKIPECSTVDDILALRCSNHSKVTFSNLHNIQTAILGNGNVSVAKAVLRSAFFVGITEAFSDSMCLLAYQIGQHDTHVCSFNSNGVRHNSSSSNSSSSGSSRSSSGGGSLGSGNLKIQRKNAAKQPISLIQKLLLLQPTAFNSTTSSSNISSSGSSSGSSLDAVMLRINASLQLDYEVYSFAVRLFSNRFRSVKM